MSTSRSEARRNILSIKAELDSCYTRYNGALVSISDFSLQEDLHKYMCIRLSGYLEQLMFEAVCGFVADASGGPAKNFALSHFKKSPNLTPDALVSLVARFGEEWEGDINDFLNTDERRNSLGNLLGIRNKVAHGASYRGSRMNVATYKELVDALHAWVMERMIN